MHLLGAYGSWPLFGFTFSTLALGEQSHCLHILCSTKHGPLTPSHLPTKLGVELIW